MILKSILDEWGLGPFTFTENMELIQNAHPLQSHKSLKWADTAWLTRGGLHRSSGFWYLRLREGSNLRNAVIQARTLEMTAQIQATLDFPLHDRRRPGLSMKTAIWVIWHCDLITCSQPKI
jgi:hypothetical protein